MINRFVTAFYSLCTQIIQTNNLNEVTDVAHKHPLLVVHARKYDEAETTWGTPILSPSWLHACKMQKQAIFNYKQQ